jgi:hypothetical protein
MRRLLKWVIITVGIAAVVKKVRSHRRKAEVSEGGTATIAEDPADELRRKLADTREPEATASGESAASEASVDERRADVHDQGHAAVDEMRSSSEGD